MRQPRIAAVALLLALPSAAAAQGTGGMGGSNSAGNITAQILAIGGENQSSNRAIWISREACLEDQDVELRIDNFPSNKQLDIYIGPKCNQVDARDGIGTDCELVITGQTLTGTQDQRITLNAADVVNLALNSDDCGSQRSMSSLWLLAVNMPGGNESVDASSFGELILNIDTDPPGAPTRVRGGRGENEIPVSWSAGTESVFSFEIYIDPGAGPAADGGVPPSQPDVDGGTASQGGETNTMCGSGALIAGDNAENVTSLRKKTEGSPTATSTTLSAGDVGDTVAAVAVVALDEAGNRSPLSAVECVFVVPTTGFKDALGDDIPQGCPCAAAGPAQVEGMLPIALALGVIAYRRRRRS